MYCFKCGKTIPDDSDFCTHCGSRILLHVTPPDVALPKVDAEQTQQTCNRCNVLLRPGALFCGECGQSVRTPLLPQNPAQKVGNDKQSTIEVHKNRFGTKKKIAIIAVCAVVIIGALTPILIKVIKATRYEAAVAMMQSDLVAAKADFEALGEYLDAAQLAQECQRIQDYNEAKNKMEAGDYTGALSILATLGDYEDASVLVQECRSAIDYDGAIELLNEGNTKEAYDIFVTLGDYRDSAQRAAECRMANDYDRAMELFAVGNTKEAYDIFAELGDYRDSAQRAAECKAANDYADAVILMENGDFLAAYDIFIALGDYQDAAAMAMECLYNQAGAYCDQGKFYSAYKLYTELGNYRDSVQRAATCAQPYPKTGEIYKDDAYNSEYAQLTITAPNDGYYTCIKIYGLKSGSDENTLASIIFLAPGKKVTIRLFGTCWYTFQVGYGTNWYGAEEMFGEEGIYNTPQFQGKDDTISSTLLVAKGTYYASNGSEYPVYYHFIIRLKRGEQVQQYSETETCPYW